MDSYAREPQDETSRQAQERLKKFVARATHGKNLPPELWPIEGDGKLDFANQLIETFVQSQVEIHGEGGVRHKQALARAAFTHAYLDGESPPELVKRIVKSGIETKENYERLALNVAGEGARVLRKKVKAKGTIAVTKSDTEAGSEYAKPKLEVVVRSEQLSTVEGYTDLDDTIKRLYHEKRPLFNETCAREFLLFFGLAQDESVSEAAIKQSLRNAAGRLRYGASKLRKVPDEHGDQHLRQGLDYIGAMTEPQHPVLLESLVYLEASRIEGDEPAARDYVYSHIAYALDEMYTAR